MSTSPDVSCAASIFGETPEADGTSARTFAVRVFGHACCWGSDRVVDFVDCSAPQLACGNTFLEPGGFPGVLKFLVFVSDEVSHRESPALANL